MNDTLYTKILQLIQVTNELARRGQMTKQAAQAKIPAVLEALVQSGRIQGHQKEAVAYALQDHPGCLDLLIKLAFHRADAEGRRLGYPYRTSDSVTSTVRYCGSPIIDWDEVEAGRRFKELLLG